MRRSGRRLPQRPAVTRQRLAVHYPFVIEGLHSTCGVVSLRSRIVQRGHSDLRQNLNHATPTCTTCKPCKPRLVQLSRPRQEPMWHLVTMRNAQHAHLDRISGAQAQVRRRRRHTRTRTYGRDDKYGDGHVCRAPPHAAHRHSVHAARRQLCLSFLDTVCRRPPLGPLHLDAACAMPPCAVAHTLRAPRPYVAERSACVTMTGA